MCVPSGRGIGWIAGQPRENAWVRSQFTRSHDVMCVSCPLVYLQMRSAHLAVDALCFAYVGG